VKSGGRGPFRGGFLPDFTGSGVTSRAFFGRFAALAGHRKGRQRTYVHTIEIKCPQNRPFFGHTSLNYKEFSGFDGEKNKMPFLGGGQA
jgi:hypothetical protein